MRGNQKVFWVGLLAVLLLAGTMAVANAQNLKRQQRGAGVFAFRGMFLAGLDLTDQQKEQIKTVLSNHASDLKTVVQDNIKARKDLRQALAQGADQASLKLAYDKVSAAGWNALLLRDNIGAEIKPILTVEQQAKLQKRLENVNKIGQLMPAKRQKRKLGI